MAVHIAHQDGGTLVPEGYTHEDRRIIKKMVHAESRHCSIFYMRQISQESNKEKEN